MDAQDRLDSWKEIAAYLGREVRTVQLWEKNEGLPVHRQQHSKQGSVYAFKSELDAWREARKSAPVEKSERKSLLIAVGFAALIGIAMGSWAYIKKTPEQSIVVLPFVDFIPQHDQDYFSDGLTEEIIDALSRVQNLRVVARTSAFSFKGHANDVREIGRQVNVNAVLEGSVRKSGDQLRITAQLNRVSDGTHLWSRTYDRQLNDVFAIQREISQAIADQLRAGTVPPREAPRDLQAWRLYKEGSYFFNQFQPPDSNYKAIERYEQAIQRDPTFSAAYSGLADAYAYLAENFVIAPREVMPKAKAAAEKAVALDPNSAEAHTSLAAVMLDYDQDRAGADRELRKAMDLNPGFAWARHWHGHALEAQNRLEDALAEMRSALFLDPLNISINWDIGNELVLLGRYAEAEMHLKKAHEMFPHVGVFGYLRVGAFLIQDDVVSARRVLEETKRDAPDDTKLPLFVAIAATVDAREGHVDEARRVAAEMEEARKTRYVEPFGMVQLEATLHDRAGLDLWLKRMQDEKSTLYVYEETFRKQYIEGPFAKR